MLVATTRRSGGCVVTAIANAALGRNDQGATCCSGPSTPRTPHSQRRDPSARLALAAAGTTGSASASGRIAETAEFSQRDAVARELPHPGPGVFEAPGAADPPSGEAEEVHLVDTHGRARRGEALPRSGVGALAAEARGHGGVFGDELDDLGGAACRVLPAAACGQPDAGRDEDEEPGGAEEGDAEGGEEAGGGEEAEDRPGAAGGAGSQFDTRVAAFAVRFGRLMRRSRTRTRAAPGRPPVP
jgi:hypothetical protein